MIILVSYKDTKRKTGGDIVKITVKAARVNANMTQKEVADKLNLSLTGYAKKENGNSKFYIDEIVILSDLFGVEYDVFFKSMCRIKTQNKTKDETCATSA